MKKLINWLIFLLTGKGEIGEMAEKAGLVSYKGQE